MEARQAVPLMTAKDVAAMLGVGITTAYNLILHKMEYIDLNEGTSKNRCIRVTPEAFEKYIRQCTRQGKPVRKIQPGKKSKVQTDASGKIHIPRWNEIHSSEERSE